MKKITTKQYAILQLIFFMLLPIIGIIASITNTIDFNYFGKYCYYIGCTMSIAILIYYVISGSYKEEKRKYDENKKKQDKLDTGELVGCLLSTILIIAAIAFIFIFPIATIIILLILILLK